MTLNNSAYYDSLSSSGLALSSSPNTTSPNSNQTSNVLNSFIPPHFNSHINPPSSSSSSSSSSPSSYVSNAVNFSSPTNLAGLPPVHPPYSRPQSSASFSSTTSSASSINSLSTPSNPSHLQSSSSNASTPSNPSGNMTSSNLASSTWSSVHSTSVSLPPPPGLVGANNKNNNSLLSSSQPFSDHRNSLNPPTRLRPAPINVAKANENILASAPSPRAAIVAGLRSATDRRQQQRQQQQQMAYLQNHQSMSLFGDYPQPPFSQGASHSKHNSLNSPTLASFQTLSNASTPVAPGFPGVNNNINNNTNSSNNNNNNNNHNSNNNNRASLNSIGPSPYYPNFGLTSPSPLVDPNDLLANLSLSPPSSPIPVERLHQHRSSQDRIDPRQLAALQQKQQELLATSRLIAQQQQRIQAAMAQAVSFPASNESGLASNNSSATSSPVQGYTGLSSPGYPASHRASPIPSLHQLTQSIQNTIQNGGSNSGSSIVNNSTNSISNMSSSYMYDSGSPLLPPSLSGTFMTQQQQPSHSKQNSLQYNGFGPVQYNNNNAIPSGFGSNQYNNNVNTGGNMNNNINNTNGFASFGGSNVGVNMNSGFASFGSGNNYTMMMNTGIGSFGMVNPPSAPFCERPLSTLSMGGGSRPSSPSIPARPSSSASLRSLTSLPSSQVPSGNMETGSANTNMNTSISGFGSGSGFFPIGSPLGSGGKRQSSLGNSGMQFSGGNGKSGVGGSSMMKVLHRKSTSSSDEGSSQSRESYNQSQQQQQNQQSHYHQQAGRGNMYKVSHGYQGQTAAKGDGGMYSLGMPGYSSNGSSVSLGNIGGNNITGAGARTGPSKYKQFEVPERQPYGGPGIEEIEMDSRLNFALLK